jgi:membrane protein implicated in regulation of membrane protease activity
MARFRSSNGGIGGSGIFGMFGTTIVCKAEDDSMYCSISKFITMWLQFLLFLVVLFLIVWVGYPYAKKHIFGKGR